MADSLRLRVVLDMAERVLAPMKRISGASGETARALKAARDRLKAAGARVLGDGEPKTGAHGKPVLFLHPKDFCGTLVELEQA